MRIALVTAFICTAALSAQAGYVVELSTGETFAVDSFWRDGGNVHLVRDGMDMIVEASRIRRLEEGELEKAPPPADEPPTRQARKKRAETERAKKGKSDTAAGEPSQAAAASDWKPPEAYRTATAAPTDDDRPIDEWSVDELERANYRATQRLLRAQAERSEAKFRDVSDSERKRIEDRFWRNKKLERKVDQQLKRRVAEMNGDNPDETP